MEYTLHNFGQMATTWVFHKLHSRSPIRDSFFKHLGIMSAIARSMLASKAGIVVGLFE